MPSRPFVTERTRRFRETKLSDFNKKKIADIEKYGFQVLSVAPSAETPSSFTSYSYTTGIYDTCGQPELVTVGLRLDTAASLLNEAARWLQHGVDLTHGRHRGLLGKVECEFRPVDTKWAKHLMLGANWYYKETEYLVLQAVYPDLENRFPEEPNFDSRFAQPLMQPNARFAEVEKEFWDATA